MCRCCSGVYWLRWERSGCIDPTFEFDVTFSSRLSSFRVTCMQDYLLESGKQSTRTTLWCSEPAGGILRTFLVEKRTWNVAVWHKLWLLCGSLKVVVRNTFIKNSVFSENLYHSLIFFRIRLFDTYEYKWMTLNWSF